MYTLLLCYTEQLWETHLFKIAFLLKYQCNSDAWAIPHMEYKCICDWLTLHVNGSKRWKFNFFFFFHRFSILHSPLFWVVIGNFYATVDSRGLNVKYDPHIASRFGAENGREPRWCVFSKQDPQTLCTLLSTSKSQSGSESVSSPSKLAASLWARARSWNSGRVGLADGLARCCSDSGRGETVALWRATTDEHGGWRCDRVKVKLSPGLTSYSSFCGYCCWAVPAPGRYLHWTVLSVQSCYHWICFYKLHLLIQQSETSAACLDLEIRLGKFSFRVPHFNVTTTYINISKPFVSYLRFVLYL